jgi:hypothetical protein
VGEKKIQPRQIRYPTDRDRTVMVCSKGWMVPFRSRPIDASPIPAPIAAAAIKLWPQACPISGRASYSPRIPTTGFADFPCIAALKAVERPATPFVTLNPAFSSSSVSRWQALVSA